MSRAATSLASSAGQRTAGRALPALAAELVALRVDVIVASVDSAVRAAKSATSTIPIVMTAAVTPAEHGFVASLSHQDSNITGLSLYAGTELRGQRLKLLKQIVRGLSRVAVLWASDTYAGTDLADHVAYAQRLGLSLEMVEIRNVGDIDKALSTIAVQHAAALVDGCLLYTSPSPRDPKTSRMPSSA